MPAIQIYKRGDVVKFYRTLTVRTLAESVRYIFKNSEDEDWYDMSLNIDGLWDTHVLDAVDALYIIGFYTSNPALKALIEEEFQLMHHDTVSLEYYETAYTIANTLLGYDISDVVIKPYGECDTAMIDMDVIIFRNVPDQGIVGFFPEYIQDYDRGTIAAYAEDRGFFSVEYKEFIKIYRNSQPVLPQNYFPLLNAIHAHYPHLTISEKWTRQNHDQYSLLRSVYLNDVDYMNS